MKLGISTLACNGWTLEKSLEVCRQNGIGALEVRMGLHPWSQLDLAEEEYRRIARAIEEAGVVVSDLGTASWSGTMTLPHWKNWSAARRSPGSGTAGGCASCWATSTPAEVSPASP